MSDYPGGTTDTHYHFEYVAQKQFEAGGFADASSTPEVDAGSGDTDQFVGYDLPAGLTAGETYRYRMLASSTAPGTSVVESPEEALTVPVAPSAGGSSACPNEVFRTGLSSHLPDCRAYEQLTPVEKGGAQELFNFRLQTGAAVVVGEDGDHVAVETEATRWGYGPGAGGSPYFFSRDEGNAWRMLAGAPQPELGARRVEPQLYNADLSQLALFAEYRTSETGESENIEYDVGPAGGPYTKVASVPRSQVGAGGGWVASSADFSKLVLQSEDRTLAGEEPTGTKSGMDLYEYTAQTGLRQVNVNSEGEPLGTCGASVAHGIEEGAEFHKESGPHSLSGDGSRVFFEAVPGKICSEPKHLYMRVNGSKTVDIGAYTFLAANGAGTRLLLERQSGEAHEVVLYETASGTVTPPFSAHSAIDVTGHSLASGDFSVLYFATEERLTPDAPGGETNVYRYEIPAEGTPVDVLRFLFVVPAALEFRGFRRMRSARMAATSTHILRSRRSSRRRNLQGRTRSGTGHEPGLPLRQPRKCRRVRLLRLFLRPRTKRGILH